jgi:hypothetical protein
MRIEFDIEEIDISVTDRTIILQSLNIEDPTEIQGVLSKIAKCSLLEYRKMFIEKGLPTKAAEVMQERLFYLIKGYFHNRLPNEQEISTIFQLTSSGAKTLLKNTMSRYRIHLKNEIRDSIKIVLNNVALDGGVGTAIIQSSALKDEINTILTQKAPSLKKFTSVKDSSGQFSCPEDTINFLKNEFGVV